MSPPSMNTVSPSEIIHRLILSPVEMSSRPVTTQKWTFSYSGQYTPLVRLVLQPHPCRQPPDSSQLTQEGHGPC